jgi:hypothetical protein
VRGRFGDFWSMQSYSAQIWLRPCRAYGDCLQLVKRTRAQQRMSHVHHFASVVPAISHDLFDLGSIWNSHIAQHPVVVFRQSSYRRFDLPLAAPPCPSVCDAAPDHDQPTRLDKPISVDLARRRCKTVSEGWHPHSKSSSIGRGLTLDARGRRNERNRFLSFVPGRLLALLSIYLAGDCRYRGRCNPVQRSTIERKPFEEEPKHRLPDRANPTRCRPAGRQRFRDGFGRRWKELVFQHGDSP